MASHDFEPVRFTNLFGALEPALRLRSGDTVRTRTLDAHGFDQANVQVADEPNPLTGPFFVEQAEEGDVLAVRLDRLAPNRTAGWSHSQLEAGLLDPAAAKLLPEQGYAAWELDLVNRRLTPAAPLPFRLKLPFAPMLGSIGVCPAGGQLLSSATSAAHGGNMDYPGITAGTTLYLPVFAPGALLYIGDGHAVQGDGEIAGSGVEVSFDVTFTVSLLKGRRIHWPRGENEGFLFTLGNARPLEQALQYATTEMVSWLQEERGLDLQAIGLLLGQAVRYDVGNVFDPAYTVACRIAKGILGP